MKFTSTNLLVEYLLSEGSSSHDNAYFRKVINGGGSDAIRRFELRIKTAKNGDEVEIVLHDIEDAMEDCGYTEDKRHGERMGNYAYGGALAGGLLSNSNDVGTGMLVGAGIGMLASAFISDDQKPIIEKHVNELRRVKILALDKMKKVR